MTAVHSGTVTPVVSWPDRQGDGLAVRLLGLRDGRAHLVERLADSDRVGVVVGASVAGGQDDRVVLEDVVLLEELLQRLRRGDAVEQPEGVADLVAQLRRGERVLLVGRQAVEELDDLGLVLEEPVVLGREELVEVEGEVDVRLVLVDGDALGQTVGDHPRDLVGQQVERRQRRVRVLLAVVLPLLAGDLLVLVGPVEDLVLVELAGRQRLERRARQVQRPLALDLVEGDVGLRGVDALVGLVDHQQVPVELGDVLELVVGAAEVLRALEVLQRQELHDARVLVLVVERVGAPLLARHRRAAGKRGRLRDELERRLVADEPREVVEPGVRDRRAVGDDEDLPDVQVPHQVVGRQRLAEPRLGVPEHLGLAGLEGGHGLVDGGLLLGPQDVVVLAVAALEVGEVLAGEVVEVLQRGLGRGGEVVPLRALRLESRARRPAASGRRGSPCP